MKIEISEDQNNLTVDGEEYEAQLNNARPHKSSCLSCVFYDKGFCQIAMKKPVGVNASDLRRCEWPYRRDMRSIFWVKKEAQQMTEAPAPAPAPAPHRHFDLIVAWAKDPTQQVWAWNSDEWLRIRAESPSWTGNHYAIGEKPTEPPIKMVKYDGGSIEFPSPAKGELERDKEYWAATIYGADRDYWTGHSSDFKLLDVGLIQLTSEGAEKQSEALVELLKNHAQKWG